MVFKIGRNRKPKLQVNILKMNGAIMPGKSGSINLDNYRALIRQAFTKKNPDLVALNLNSPGGSPSQSDRIYEELMYWKKETGVPLYVVVDDVCASGGIWIAMAADKIFANRMSVIGSIGVISSFPYVAEAMKPLKLEMRTYTAGKSKAGMSPFNEITQEQEAETNDRLNEIHEAFIKHVKIGRSERLKIDTPDLFEGKVWLGEAAKDIGLIDGLGGEREAIASHPDYEGANVVKRRFARKSGGKLGQLLGRGAMEMAVDVLYDKLHAEAEGTPFRLQ